MVLDSLSQVSAGARLLSAVRLRDAEGVAQRRDARLQVELRRLCQVRVLTEVVEAEEGGAALHLRLHQSGRSYLRITTNKQTSVFSNISNIPCLKI